MAIFPTIWTFILLILLCFFFPVCLKVVAASVACNPEKFSASFLCKPNEAYCTWILDHEKWEGEFQ
jgi:hypothetical protein